MAENEAPKPPTPEEHRAMAEDRARKINAAREAAEQAKQQALKVAA